MDKHLVAEDPSSRKTLILLKAAEMRRRRGISRSQEYLLLKKGLLPKPVWQGSSRYYLEHEIEADTAALIAERDASD
jgi:predicted DNA-binding transcriptional regulator AlpA